MPNGAIVEDMRGVGPIAYIRAVGLRPEDCYGFLPLDQSRGASYFFLYRDRPEYEQARANIALPADGGVADFTHGSTGGLSDFGVGFHAKAFNKINDITERGNERIRASNPPPQGFVPSLGPPRPPIAPPTPEDEANDRRIELDRLRAQGEIDEHSHRMARSMATGGAAGPQPGGVPPAPAAPDAPAIVSHRIYPGIHPRSNDHQLNSYMPTYREMLGLCPEDVYGVFPRSFTRTDSGSLGSGTFRWDDFWIIYRDRPAYAQAREEWGQWMIDNGGPDGQGVVRTPVRLLRKGTMKDATWPAPDIVPGVAAPGAAAFDGTRTNVEKDRWPREKVVIRQIGAELGDSLRAKIGRWGYQPEDSLGFCPSFTNSSIYFAWRKR